MSDPQPDSLLVSWRHQAPAELLTQIGEWLEDRGNLEEAYTYFGAAVTVDPQYSLAAFRHGKLALKNHHYSIAVTKLELAARLTPDHAPTHYSASLAYAALDRSQEALSAAERALELDPHHAGARLQVARALAKLERWQDLRTLIEGSQSTHASHEANLLRALAAYHLNDPDGARTILSRVPQHARRHHCKIVEQLNTLKA
jgi:tetratricopeptide (TPR) repeat protein